MHAKLDIIQALTVGSKSRNENVTFDIWNECFINFDTEVKHLGIAKGFKLQIDIYMSKCCKKSSRQLSFVQNIVST